MASSHPASRGTVPARVVRCLAALAATCALAGCAVAVPASPPPRDAATASTTPTPAPSRPAVSAPAASGVAGFQPGRYSVGDGLTSFVDFAPDGSAYLMEQPHITSRDAYEVSAGTVTFSGDSCGGGTGTYRWSAEANGGLHLKPVDEPCVDRLAVLAHPLDRVRAQLPYVGMEPSKAFTQPDYNRAAVDAGDRFYTTDAGPDVFQYDRDGNLLRSWTGVLTYTVGITVTRDGSMYVSNFDDATVHAFSAAGEPVRGWTVGGGNVGPVGLAHDGSGNVYVALHRIQDHYVEKYSPVGKLLGSWATQGSGDGQVGADEGGGPESIAVTPDGASYLGDIVNNRLVKFGPDGRFEYAITGDGTTNLDGPAFVAVDGKGNVFTISSQTLWEFDATGKPVGRWFSPYEVNIVVDDADNLFLVDDKIIGVRLPTP